MVAVVPVVDVEAVPVEVPDVDVVAVRVDERCPFPSVTPKIEGYCHKMAYILFLLYLIWEQFLCRTSPPEKGKKFLCLESHAIAIRRRRYSGELKVSVL